MEAHQHTTGVGGCPGHNHGMLEFDLPSVPEVKFEEFEEEEEDQEDQVVKKEEEQG